MTMTRTKRNQWIVVGLAAVLGAVLWSWRGRVAGPGTTIEASISLVTTDRDDLACASEAVVRGHRCAFRAPGRPWSPPPRGADLLAPYYTTDQHLIVIAGLFEQPPLAARQAAEAPLKLPRDQRPRFAAHCKLKLVGRLPPFKSRWLAGADWASEEAVWVAEPSACQLSP